jgi:hypothetical protein
MNRCSVSTREPTPLAKSALRVARGESPLDIDAEYLDPTSYLGSADEFVDRALAFYRSELG